MKRDEKDAEMICGLTADEHSALRAGLEALPDTMPRRVVWQRIREQAEAEGLLQRGGRSTVGAWLAGAGVAAAGVLVAVIFLGQPARQDADFPATPTNAVTNAVPVTALEALMVESRELEDDLRTLPSEPRVVRAGTQATILDIEDRIAAIDYQLSDPDVQLSPEDEEIFWHERVRLMKSLVRLRYAQAQRATY